MGVRDSVTDPAARIFRFLRLELALFYGRKRSARGGGWGGGGTRMGQGETGNQEQTSIAARITGRTPRATNALGDHVIKVFVCSLVFCYHSATAVHPTRLIGFHWDDGSARLPRRIFTESFVSYLHHQLTKGDWKVALTYFGFTRMNGHFK